MLAIGPGETHTQEWDGNIFTLNTSHCTDGCECQEATRAQAGNYSVRVRVYRSIQCDESDCAKEGVVHGSPDTQGRYTDHDVTFAVPSDADQLVIEVDD